MQGDTDRDWESFALTDPYWAVFSSDEFRRENLTAESLDRLFASGNTQAEAIVQTFRNRFGAPGQVELALDFGCGVGRLLLGLAARSRKAVGVDVSPTMLALCSENVQRRQVANVELYRSDDQLSAVSQYTAAVDLITSYIVFQHIPPPRGYKIFDSLLRLLKPGGFGFLHFTFASSIEGLQHEGGNMTGSLYKYYQRTSGGLLKLFEYPAGDMQIQMNHYNLNELFCYLYESGVVNSFVQLTQHSGSLGAELYFQKAL